MSDLLREQLFLQSELSSNGCAPSTNPSSRSCSPVRGGDDSEQRQSVYRASINITPALPPRPNACTEGGVEIEGVRDAEGGRDEGGGGELAEDRATGGVRVENLQQLIREVTALRNYLGKICMSSRENRWPALLKNREKQDSKCSK